MNLPYGSILKALKDGPKTKAFLIALDKEGDTMESLLCMVARGWVKTDDMETFTINTEALEREKSA